MRFLRGSLVAVGVMLTGCERSMIYFPTRASEPQLLAQAQAAGLQPWRNSQGERIGWRTAAPVDPANTRAALVFHGNAGHAAMRTYFVDGFRGLPGSWQVFLLEYPGYGSRAGAPSETSVKAAAEEAFTLLRQEGHRARYLAGESLGSGVAAHVASRHGEAVDGVILITPFTSLTDVAAHHYPRFLVRLLLREHYDNVEALQNYQGPVGIVVAADDEVVPAALGQQLHERYAGPKRLWVQLGRTHNTVDYTPNAAWWRELAEFWNDGSARR